jgi:hypothetical protein
VLQSHLRNASTRAIQPAAQGSRPAPQPARTVGRTPGRGRQSQGPPPCATPQKTLASGSKWHPRISSFRRRASKLRRSSALRGPPGCGACCARSPHGARRRPWTQRAVSRCQPPIAEWLLRAHLILLAPASGMYNPPPSLAALPEARHGLIRILCFLIGKVRHKHTHTHTHTHWALALGVRAPPVVREASWVHCIGGALARQHGHGGGRRGISPGAACRQGVVAHHVAG